MTHYIKILKSYADAIAEGRKNFEVRRNDRGYNAGDIVEFEVLYSDGTTSTVHDVCFNKYRITYVHSGLGVKDGYVVFGIEEIDDEKSWNHWTDDRKDYVECPNCEYGSEGEVLLENKTPYCPMCGADLRGEIL